MILPRGSLMKWNSTAVTEHNREALDVTPKRIETANRMADGTMRKYVVATKKEFSTSWTNLPSATTATVDGFMGGAAILAFYEANIGDFTLQITNGDGTTETYTVMFTDFNKKIKKRGPVDLYDISVTMEEV